MPALHITGIEAAKQLGSSRSWGSQVWMANHALTGSAEALARMLLRPGHSAKVHRHPNADEVIYLIAGQVTVHVDSETFLLKTGDALSIPAGATHRIENLGMNDAELILCYSLGNREYVPA